MTATILESEQDTDITLSVSEQPDEAIPCDHNDCQDEAEYEVALHCCQYPLNFCEDHMLWIYREYKKMFDMFHLGIHIFLCALCRTPHGRMECFKATPLKS